MKEFFRGKKTYILAVAALVVAWGTFATGDLTMQEAIEASFVALGGIFMRNAIAGR